jgi:hypothetical protein
MNKLKGKRALITGAPPASGSRPPGSRWRHGCALISAHSDHGIRFVLPPAAHQSCGGKGPGSCTAAK